MSPRSSLKSTRPPVPYTAAGLSQSTTKRYGEKTMLRLAVRARTVCSENLEKCVDKSVQKRELSASATILNASSRRGAHEPRLRCLIDPGTRSNDTEGRRRALSTTSTTTTVPTTTPRKTCLYDLHVENRGECSILKKRNISPAVVFIITTDRSRG